MTNLNQFTAKFPLYFVLLSLLFILASCSNNETVQKAPTEVKVTKVLQQDVPINQDFVGQIYGEYDIPIRARVSGWIESIHFREGKLVNKDQLLYTIDKQPFLAKLAQQESVLAEAKTAYVKAESDLNRYKPLAKKNAVSKSDLDAAQANYDAAVAYVEAAEASVDLAKIELSYCEIKSPLSGLIGKTQAKVGEFVGQEPNPVILNTVSSTNMVRVEFFLTESDYLLFARKRPSRNQNNNDTSSVQKPILQLLLSDGSVHPYEGKIDFINREIDQETGSLLVQSSFPNPEGILRPGQFARVRVQVQQEKQALILPQRCFSEIQGMFSVTVVNNENKVEIKQVIVGAIYKDYRIILDGLEVGESVVLEGIQKVRPGMLVAPQEVDYKSEYKEEIIK